MTETKAKKNFFKDTNIGQAWLVLVMAIVFGALLAVVQITLAPKIAANIQAETYSAVPALVYGAGNVPKDAEVNAMQLTGKSGAVYTVYAVTSNNKINGFAVKGVIMGYADNIEMLVGLNANISEITGIFVLFQKETPGLGNKITEPAWNGQFIGKSTAAPLAVRSGQPQTNIDAISGATISSVAVTNIVNTVVGDLKTELIKKAGE